MFTEGLFSQCGTKICCFFFFLSHSSIGSVIVYFDITIVSDIDPEELIAKSKNLSDSLSAKMSMETAGNYITSLFLLVCLCHFNLKT